MKEYEDFQVTTRQNEPTKRVVISAWEQLHHPFAS